MSAHAPASLKRRRRIPAPSVTAFSFLIFLQTLSILMVFFSFFPYTEHKKSLCRNRCGIRDLARLPSSGLEERHEKPPSVRPHASSAVRPRL